MKKITAYQCEHCEDFYLEEELAINCEKHHNKENKIHEISCLLLGEYLDIVSTVNGVNCLICTKERKIYKKDIVRMVESGVAISNDEKLNKKLKNILNK